MQKLSLRSQDYVPVESGPNIQPFETSRREDSSVATEAPKTHFKVLEALALLVTWLCFAVAVVAISPSFKIAWELGVQRQIQVLGVMLSVMSLCTKYLIPGLLVVAESRFGVSRLQNYLAFWQNSTLVADTQLGWRILLLAFTILPIALSLGYKEFLGGTAHHQMSNTGGEYGMTAPGGLSSDHIFKFGPTYMTNATIPYLLATTTTKFFAVTMPQAYGLNILSLSNTSSAYLDMPMPRYMGYLQTQLDETRYFILKAQVHGTVTSYNGSIETNRNDRSFWNQFYGPLNLTGQQNLDQSKFYVGNLQSNKSIVLLNSNLHNDFGDIIDNSWSIISFIPAVSDSIADFEANAMLFNTHRRVCEGTWNVTSNIVKLLHGDCNVSSVPDQGVFTNFNLDFNNYYGSTLVEYLAPLSTNQTERKEVYVKDNRWRMSIFTTVVAGMYWSRSTAFMGYDNSDIFETRPQKVQDEIYYHLSDTLISSRPTLMPDWKLYFVIAVFPVLATFIFLGNLIMSFFSRIDGGNFGVIALLGGTEKESLKIFDGASVSGALQKPVFVQVKPLGSKMNAKGREIPQNQYIFSVNRQ
ncbi:MAG: hypothetical protein LQ351_007408 [Letrouitia transgressa]|nr:MAG: hypothetical protein LQ351_007408 [Letrouitia transgressa]